MTGKERCEYLKDIRKKMAEEYSIAYEPRECHHEGECSGTCPLCEKEAAYLLEQIKAKGGLHDQGTNRRKRPGLWKRLKNKYNAFFDNMHTGIIVDD